MRLFFCSPSSLSLSLSGESRERAHESIRLIGWAPWRDLQTKHVTVPSFDDHHHSAYVCVSVRIITWFETPGMSHVTELYSARSVLSFKVIIELARRFLFPSLCLAWAHLAAFQIFSSSYLNRFYYYFFSPSFSSSLVFSYFVFE